ncbi:MAG: UTP--glucose-1-phosphate uridylyltransferase [Planctomycetales bacterium]
MNRETPARRRNSREGVVVMSESRQELWNLLEPHSQQHALRYWDALTTSQQSELAEQIRGVDFNRLDALWRAEETTEDWNDLAARAEAPPVIRMDGENAPCSEKEALLRGQEALALGEVGAVLVAGGRGTRLGYDRPKGLFPIGPVSKASLFQTHLEKLRATSRRYGRDIPLCVMTSSSTHDETQAFLNEADFFGVSSEELTLFRQGVMPVLDAESGNLLLEKPHRLLMSPDGHGGALFALRREGLLDAMRSRGIRCVFYFQVDNPLTIVCDPRMIGFHLLTQSQITIKVAAKKTPWDNHGAAVNLDGKLRMIEYSELPETQADRKDERGQPIFWAGNVGVHVFDLDFLDECSASEQTVPFHRAHKTVQCLGESGLGESGSGDVGSGDDPESRNAAQFERFIFDVFPLTKKTLLVEADRESEYAPLKNQEGERSPEGVRASIVRLHRRWLENAGAAADQDALVEFSPLFALDEFEVKTKIRRGMTFRQSHYFLDSN